MLLEALKNQLIVSCQALPDEPLHSPFIMGRMALAAKQAGAAAIRCQSVPDIEEIKKTTGLPVIGLIKRNYQDSAIYITPTCREVRELTACGCEIIAADATLRARPGNESLKTLLELIHAGGALALADIATDAEGINAAALGFDAVSTTMSGYAPGSPALEGPDFGLVARLAGRLDIPVFAEGRINTPSELKTAFELGAWGVIVGSAITRPQLIARRFAAALPQHGGAAGQEH